MSLKYFPKMWQSKDESQFEFFLETLRPTAKNVLDSKLIQRNREYMYVFLFFCENIFFLASQQSALFDILRLAIFNEFKNSASLPGVANSKHRKRERERKEWVCYVSIADCFVWNSERIQKKFMMFFGISKKTHYINVSPKQFLRFQAAMKLALNWRCPIFETISPKRKPPAVTKSLLKRLL